MRQSVKKVVRKLPGLTSYCSCVKSCSNVEVDHLIPKFLLKQKSNQYNKSINDMHNLFRCCTKINNPKGCKILGDDWVVSKDNDWVVSKDNNDLAYVHNSYLARAALYMDMQYDLNVSKDLLLIWKNMALQTEIFEFEKQRHNIIKTHQKTENPFITEFPSSIILYQ